MLDAIKSRVRGAVVGWLDLPKPEVPPPHNGKSSPIGIDAFRKLPVHFEPPECPLCIFEDGICHDCNGTLQDPEAPFTYGVESETVRHVHIHTIPDSGGKQTRVPVRRKLCIRCFRLDWASVHPEKPCGL